MAAKQVRITSCRDCLYWYAQQIGRWFELHHLDREYIWVIDHQGFVNRVDRNDAFILEPEHGC